MIRMPSSFLMIAAGALSLGACGSSPPERFYSLAPASEDIPHSGKTAYSVAVGPATVPEMIDRPQMVLNEGANRVTIAEQARWAEPIKESIPRVIAADLARKLPEAYVTASPGTTMSRPDYTVLVDVQRFESAQGQAATIEITWAVDSLRGGSRTAGKSFEREPVNGDDFASLVSAHQRALNAASRDIAEAIKGKAEKTTLGH